MGEDWCKSRDGPVEPPHFPEEAPSDWRASKNVKRQWGTVPIVAFVALVPLRIAGIYTDDMEFAKLVVPSIIVICSGTVFQCIGNAFFDAVSGTGNTRAALYMETIILVIYILFILAMTHLTTQVEWIWTAEIIYGVLLGTFSYLYIKSAKWSKTAV